MRFKYNGVGSAAQGRGVRCARRLQHRYSTPAIWLYLNRLGTGRLQVGRRTHKAVATTAHRNNVNRWSLGLSRTPPLYRIPFHPLASLFHRSIPRRRRRRRMETIFSPPLSSVQSTRSRDALSRREKIAARRCARVRCSGTAADRQAGGRAGRQVPDYLSFAGRRAPHPSPVKLSRKFFRAETSVLEINIDESRSPT